MLKKNKKRLFLFFLSLVLILFLIKAGIFIQNQKILSFDTLREITYIKSSLNSGNVDKPSEFGLSILIVIFSLFIGIPPSYIVIFFGYLILFLTGIFCFLIVREIEDKYFGGIIFAFFLLSELFIFNAENFRPEIFSYLMQTMIIFFIILGFKYKKIKYIFLTYIPFLFLINTHKTGIFMIGIILLASFIFFILNFKEKKFTQIYQYLIFGLVLIATIIGTLLSYIKFYFGSGKQISPAGFNLNLEPILGFFNFFGIGISIFFIFGLIYLIGRIIRKKYDKKIILYSFITLMTIFFYSLIVIFPRMGISILPTRFYNYLLLYVLFLLPFSIKEISKHINKPFFLIILTLLLISSLPSFYSDELRITASPNYLTELDNVPFQKGDLIITTFTSSPALISSISSNPDFKNRIVIISGYNIWGDNNQLIPLIKKIYSINNENELNSAICKIQDIYKQYLLNLPEAKDFLVIEGKDKEELIKNLEKPRRVLLIYSKFDLENRNFNQNQNLEQIKWWEHRATPDIDYKSLLQLKNLDKLYESENMIILKVNLNQCEN